MMLRVAALLHPWLRLAAALTPVAFISRSPRTPWRARQGADAAPGQVDAYYASRAGGPNRSNSVPFKAPTDFSLGPSWAWPNEQIEQVRHSPLVDADRNIYVATTTRIRKFSPDGGLLWTWQAPAGEGWLDDSPSLYGGAVFALVNGVGPVHGITLVSISADSGDVGWSRFHNNSIQLGDAGSLSVFNGTIFFGAMRNLTSGPTSGNNVVVAASATDGRRLWEYVVGDVVWNFSPSTPGDGTLIFAGCCGAVFRISFGGELIWRAGAPPQPGVQCSTGGGALGPNGVFYAEHSDSMLGPGFVAAYRVEDGHPLWSRRFDLPGFQAPAVGVLGAGGPLAVLAALGNLSLGVPYDPAVERSFVASGWQMKNVVVALNAATGETLWHSEEEPWNHSYAAGDEDMWIRHNRLLDGSPAESPCWPDNQGIPLIAGDGTVYASSSHDGRLRAIRDADGDGTIEPSEISTFDAHYGFLNSPSAAPGMLVVAPCWGPVYVFRDDAP